MTVHGRPSPPLMDDNLPTSPNYTTWNEKPNDTYRATHGSTGTKPYYFKHPFRMIVAGPSRSGKTHWVIKLLIKKHSKNPIKLYTVTLIGKIRIQCYRGKIPLYVGTRGFLRECL